MVLVGLVHREYDGGVDDVVLSDHHMQRTSVDLAEQHVTDAAVVLIDLDDLVATSASQIE